MSVIYETLMTIYLYVPKELLIIILGGLTSYVFLCYDEIRREKQWNKPKRQRSKK